MTAALLLPKDTRRIAVDLNFTQISHSRVQSWRRCQMQHHYRYYQRLRRKTKPRPLYLGSAVHTCLEALIESGSYAEEIVAINSELAKLFREEREELGDIPGHVVNLIEGYKRVWKNDGLVYPIRRHNRKTEFRVIVEIAPRIIFVGVIDAMPIELVSERVYVMDHKTAKNIPDEDSRFSDLQLLMYFANLEASYLPKADGVLWDYIRTKPPAVPETLKNGQVSMRKNIDTTPDVYLRSVAIALQCEPKDIPEQYTQFVNENLMHKDRDFYTRIPLAGPSRQMIDNVTSDFVATGREIRERGPTATVRSMRRDCKMCSYYPLCAAEVRGYDTDMMRKQLYEVKGGGEEKDVEPDDSGPD